MPTDLPAPLAETWQPLGTRTGKTTVLVASITAEMTLYEPSESTAATDLGSGDIPVRSLFAVDLSISPSLSTIGVAPDAVLSKAAPKAKEQFVDTVTDEGLTVGETRDTLAFEGPNGAAGKWYVLDAAYPVDPDLTSEGPAQIAAEANVAVWPTETSYGVAGGVLPLESVETGETGDAAASSAEDGTDELVVDPERDRETISALIRSIEFGGGGSDREIGGEAGG